MIFFNTITPHTTEIFSHSHTIVVITKINYFLITVDTRAGQNEFFQKKIFSMRENLSKIFQKRQFFDTEK